MRNSKTKLVLMHTSGSREPQLFTLVLSLIKSIITKEMKLQKQYNTLRLILGDQLNIQHSWYNKTDDDTLYVIMEMKQETDYTRHHIQKIVSFFLAMRNMAKALESKGHHVLYYQLDDEVNTGDLISNLQQIIKKYQINSFEYQLPDEYRLDQQLKNCADEIGVTIKAYDTEHFLTTRGYLADFFKGKKTTIMESFYRSIRKEYGILMEENDPTEPLTGKWNYDKENRKSLSKTHEIIKAKTFPKNVESIIQQLKNKEVETIGNIDPSNFIWPTTYQEVDEMLEFFVDECLANFGKYQDAMVERDWSLYHSRLSFAMNSKMIKPISVVNRAIAKFKANQDLISIAQIEGFVRQIIGWREFMRGIYWAHMPQFKEKNFFNHKRSLPKFFWTGKTKMNCMSHAINQSLNYSYAHHIQRLMITGNFALLTETNPDELDEWYLGIYIDAIEWVEITNTRGMSQFADGGIVGTKPYVSSANYINKMSDYCKGCKYNFKEKTGENACPFNSLYWRFYAVNEDKLGKNNRIGMMYNVWRKKSAEEQEQLINQAEYYLENIENL